MRLLGLKPLFKRALKRFFFLAIALFCLAIALLKVFFKPSAVGFFFCTYRIIDLVLTLNQLILALLKGAGALGDQGALAVKLALTDVERLALGAHGGALRLKVALNPLKHR